MLLHFRLCKDFSFRLTRKPYQIYDGVRNEEPLNSSTKEWLNKIIAKA